LKLFEHIKKRIIKGLIEEITCLDATGIELVGYNYISLRENQPLIHHGLNKDYMPSGYTVDTFSDDSSIVGEYSAEKGYFDYSGDKENPIYSKIEKDIHHALKHRGELVPDKIYLISNQEEKSSFRAKFNSTQVGREHGDRLIIIDARELAKGVYNQSIKNPDSADYYKQYFPAFSQNMDNYEYFGKLPNVCDEYICEDSIINSISSHFASGINVCILHGVSGSGKTQSAIDFVKKNKDTFPNYIWIGGEDWNPDSSLCSVQRSRGGSPVNVAGLFNSEKSILVIDNYTAGLKENNFEELASGFEKGGVVLVTSQISVPNNSEYLSIPQFSIDRALDLLGETESSSSELCWEFISKCRFSPLILSMTKNLCHDQGIDKEIIYREILDDPELIDDASGASIVRKILSGLGDSSLDALKKIANSGKNYHDIEFLRHFIGALKCNTLQKLSILVPDNTTGVLRVHDLISIAAQDKIDSSPIVASIEDFISLKAGDMTPSVLRQIHLCSDLIFEEHMRRGERDIDWLHYSLLQLEGDGKLELHHEIHDINISANDNLQKIKSIIDAKEIHSYTISNNSNRKDYYGNCASIYDELLKEDVSEDVQLELLHHKGKALRRSGKYIEALDAFNQLLELKPEWHATYGQIAHLGTQYKVEQGIKEAGEKAMRSLLDFIQSEIFSVPLRVSLAALARLRSYRQVVQEINDQEELVKKLADVISISALEGLDQFYEAFVSFTSMFGYKHSVTCVSIAESIPELIAIPPSQVEKRQWLSACEALTNSSVAAGRECNERLSNLLIGSALSFANEISNCEKLSSYEGRCVAKTYNFAGEPESAIASVKKVPEVEVNHWLLYEESKAYLELGENHHNDALSSAKKCFDLAKEDKSVAPRISIYHDLLSGCYKKLNDQESAIREIRKAVENCTNDKYRSELELRLANLTKC
jgi:tetratricopeptide (TPR) repeat protein